MYQIWFSSTLWIQFEYDFNVSDSKDQILLPDIWKSWSQTLKLPFSYSFTENWTNFCPAAYDSKIKLCYVHKTWQDWYNVCNCSEKKRNVLYYEKHISFPSFKYLLDFDDYSVFRLGGPNVTNLFHFIEIKLASSNVPATPLSGSSLPRWFCIPSDLIFMYTLAQLRGH